MLFTFRCTITLTQSSHFNQTLSPLILLGGVETKVSESLSLHPFLCVPARDGHFADKVTQATSLENQWNDICFDTEINEQVDTT